MDRPIETTAVREMYRNRFITVFDDDVRFSSGAEGNYLRIVESNGARGVVALPICGDLIGLVKTYRYALEAFEWGLPRGFAQSIDTSLTVLAELNEELGDKPVAVERLGEMTPNSGLLTSTVDVFVARYDQPIASPTDVQVVSQVKWIRTSDLFDEIRAGRIIDGFTLSTLCLARLAGLLPPH
jgi:ADP-ribose pyrophosphatase